MGGKRVEEGAVQVATGTAVSRTITDRARTGRSRMIVPVAGPGAGVGRWSSRLGVHCETEEGPGGAGGSTRTDRVGGGGAAWPGRSRHDSEALTRKPSQWKRASMESAGGGGGGGGNGGGNGGAERQSFQTVCFGPCGRSERLGGRRGRWGCFAGGRIQF